MARFAVEEAARIGILKAEEVEDSRVVHASEAHPAYFSCYRRFEVIHRYTGSLENAFLVARNGMHKYNKQDHSMLAVMTAVGNVVNGIAAKDHIWAINTETGYHEERTAS